MNYVFALAAALLFAVSVPAGKILLTHLKPMELSALCYFGSGLGLALWRAFVPGRSGSEAPLGKRDLPYTAGFILSGGVLAPVLLFTGLSLTSSSCAAMLLNFELVFTSLIAVIIFREYGGWRLWAAAALITAGGLALSRGGGTLNLGWGAALVLCASLMWGLDNNLTARVSMKDPVALAAIKGLAGGFINGLLAFHAYRSLPEAKWVFLAMALGFFSYGVSLVLLILAMRGLGASRAGAFFGSYPFIGAALSVALLGDPASAGLLCAGALMLAALLLLAAEEHGHRHRHDPVEHEHAHGHGDPHHGHSHCGAEAGEHSHPHLHDPVEHDHPHLPDAHHRHRHG